MIIYRKYRDEDYSNYKIFCQNNWGKYCHQSNFTHIQWLQSNPSHFINIAVESNRILACFHGFLTPIKNGNKIENYYSLHDLMVDKDYRGIGLKLMQEGLFQDRPVILSGASGRISRAYKRLGSTKFNSQWYQKFIFPTNIFNSYLISFEKIKRIQKKSIFTLVNNKEGSSKKIIDKISKFYNYDKSIYKYFEWRFFHKYSPLTFFMMHKNNIILFSLGYKKFIPFLRIFSGVKENDEEFYELMKSVEKFGESIGIFFILYTITENIRPPQILNYQKHKRSPDSYLFSIDKKDFSQVLVNGFSTDTGFESYTFKTLYKY